MTPPSIRDVVARWLNAPPWDRPQHVDWWIGLYGHAGGDCGEGAEMAAYDRAHAEPPQEEPAGPVVRLLVEALGLLAIAERERGR